MHAAAKVVVQLDPCDLDTTEHRFDVVRVVGQVRRAVPPVAVELLVDLERRPDVAVLTGIPPDVSQYEAHEPSGCCPLARANARAKASLCSIARVYARTQS